MAEWADKPWMGAPLPLARAMTVPPASQSPAGAPSGSDRSHGHSGGPGTPPRRTLRRDWLLLALSLGVLLAVVLPPLVNLGRYQHRLVEAMSRSLGRDVTMSAVHLRLLPMPALVLTDVVVHEAAGFGAEPALRAPRVVAQLRLTSLWRRQLEVSRVEMSDASLNLVRDQQGRWNVGTILLQASHVANAPTGQKRAGPAPRFPYIEITDSRINVKQGVEKLPYSLLNTDLSMWLADPDLWQIRVKGQPVRTDIELGLADTGTLRIEGKLHRATALGQMPLALHGDWSNAPLGQASRLLLGDDPGWRGDLHASADVSGDLDQLLVNTHVTVANLHREEFSPAEPFMIDATCHAAYSRAARTLSDLGCRWPIGDGVLLLSGSIGDGMLPLGGSATGPSAFSAGARPDGSGPLGSGPLGSAPLGPAPLGKDAALALTVQRLPASTLVAAAGLARSDFNPAFHLDGALSGVLFYNAHPGAAPIYAGVLEADQLHLSASGLSKPLDFGDTRLAATMPASSGRSTLVLTTAPVDLGGTAPATMNAQLSSEGFLLHAGGGASISRLEELGHATHLLPTALASLEPEGAAEFDVTEKDSWHAGELPVELPASIHTPNATLNPFLNAISSATTVPQPAPRPRSRGRQQGRQQGHHRPASKRIAPGRQPRHNPRHDPRHGQASLRAHRAHATPGLQPRLAAPAATGISGWLRLHNASYVPGFLSAPVSLITAEGTFSPGQVTWNVPSAVFDHLPLQLTASHPLGCEQGPGCVTSFHLSTADLDAAALAAEVLGGSGSSHLDRHLDRHLLDQLLSRLNPGALPWPEMEGTVHADSFTLGRLVLRNATASIAVSGGETRIENLDAQALGGSLHAQGAITMQGAVPHYNLFAVLTNAGAAEIGGLFAEDWGAGTLTLSSQVQLDGAEAAQLLTSAVGQFHGEWSRGGLGTDTPLARFAQWTGYGIIGNQSLTLTQSELTTGSGDSLPVTGKLGFDRTLHLQVNATTVQTAVQTTPQTTSQSTSQTTAQTPSGADASATTVTGTLSHPTE